MILNGITTQTVLTGNKNFSWFDEEYSKYAPNPEIINKLKPLINQVKVIIIAGTWCGDTQRELPRFLKIANEIGIPNQNIEIVMVDENKKTPVFNVSVYKITNIPTFIVFKNGNELGRIIEKPISSLEEDLSNILN